MDHAVWRFVLLQTYAHLQHTAHPAYKTGLAATGIGVERIPRIEEMNQRLSAFGWGAVCVDGFIPPRAFQGFQAAGLLPIAAEIRSVEHLAYTPAPDIIHEAAGHAPILSEPAYARFLRAIGATSEKAFATPSDRAVYQAIHALSELKEHPASTPTQIKAAETALHRALHAVNEVSESARMARLYWWTAEYGLVGSLRDYKLYGAGLLSSLGESRSCHDESVRKLPLSAECVHVDYDITRPQPQLFVARDFDHLCEVLDDVSQDLAFRRGDATALETARRSEETATLTLDTGLSVLGVVASFTSEAGLPTLVQLSGRPALALAEALLEARCPNDYVLPVGRLIDGRELSALSADEIARLTHEGKVTLSLASGSRVTGIVRDMEHDRGRVRVLWLEDFALTLPDGRTFRSRPPYPLALAGALTSVAAGAPSAYFGASEPSTARVPRPRWFTPHERALLELYERAMHAWKNLAGAQLVQAFEHLTNALDRAYPEDWLLRWNLLESLVKVADAGPLPARLAEDLERLEVKYMHQAPIASGLAYIRGLAGLDDSSSADLPRAQQPGEGPPKPLRGGAR